MTLRRSDQRLMMIALPIVAGVGTLLAVPWLLPDARELQGVDARAQPSPVATDGTVSLPVIAGPTPTASATPAPPSLAALVRTADAATLSTETDRLSAQGAAVSTLSVAHDLIAAKRPDVARSYLAARPDGTTPATWRLRFDLMRTTGDAAAATALLAAAAAARTGVPASDVVAAAYAIDRPDLIVQAARTGAIPAPDAALTLDLARRLEAKGRTAAILALDTVSRTNWRAADPWLALRVANRAGDTTAALRAAASLPARDRAAAEQAILTRNGDRAGLVAALRREAGRPGADRAAIAERLLAAGDRPAAIATLQAAAATLPTTAPAARRLLYLMGPRPEAQDIAWLRRRAAGGKLDWLLAYADRDIPRDALAVLARHPEAGRTDVLMARLRLARAADDDAGGSAALAQLLDGRPLAANEVRRIATLVPQRTPPALTAALTRRRAELGLVAPQERMDLAWRAWNRGDARGTAGILRTYLADRPNDPVALRLMGDVQGKLSGDDAARPWFDRALDRTPTPGRDRAELLERLGRRAEATRMVADLRAARPADRSLAALHARLLIAQGEPGRAREVLAQ